ncbi:MAG: CheR family methyltransferase, partial [Methyloceanibacter sp.]|nr:CheR family methyltransferase [Methyloceanibacter sp.]
MRAHEFQRIGEVLRDYSGAELGENTMSAVTVKLAPVLDEFAFPTIAHLTMALAQPGNVRLRQRVAEAVAVPESYFFRNKDCFAYIDEVMLPRLMQQRATARRIRIWSAACSTGQEPYSLAMLLSEKGKALDGWTVEIVASDLSHDLLRKARGGAYTQFEVQRGLPARLLIKYFDKAGALWQVKPEIRDRVVFRDQNLLHSCAALGQFDIILCRNVLIYFGVDQRVAVLSRMARRLQSDGYLVLGAAETTLGFSRDFKRVPEQQGGVYCLGSEAASETTGELEPEGQASHRAFRSVRLDRVIADRLEAMAHARGMTLSALLSEMSD